jgi:hypothetical protein
MVWICAAAAHATELALQFNHMTMPAYVFGCYPLLLAGTRLMLWFHGNMLAQRPAAALLAACGLQERGGRQRSMH